MRKSCLLSCLLLISYLASFAQNGIGVKQLLIADSISSGNYKDILSSFFNLSLKDLTAPNKVVKFDANLFAILLKQNPSLIIDTNFRKYTTARNLNLSAGVKLDSSSKLDGATLGIKYALINKRDYSIAKDFIPMAMKRNQDFDNLNDFILNEIEKIPDATVRRKYTAQTNSFFSHDSTKFKSLDEGLQKIVRESSKKPGAFSFAGLENYQDLSLRELSYAAYKTVTDSFQNRPLLTAAINTQTYSDRFQLKSLHFELEYLQGVSNPQNLSNVELNVKSFFDIGDDTRQIGGGTKRKSFTIEAGVNWVFKNALTRASYLELKFTTAHAGVINGIYPAEAKQKFTLNGTIRFRASHNFWVPLEFKYDPKTGNVYGFLNISSNFNWLN